jgi:uncharacterized protein (TIGR02118 family)
MIVLTVMYPNTAGSKFDMDYYVDKHMPLVHERLEGFGLKRSAVIKGVQAGGMAGGPAAYQVLTNLYFEDPKKMGEGMQAHGPEILGDIANFTDAQPTSQLSDPVKVTEAD